MFLLDPRCAHCGEPLQYRVGDRGPWRTLRLPRSNALCRARAGADQAHEPAVAFHADHARIGGGPQPYDPRYFDLTDWELGHRVSIGLVAEGAPWANSRLAVVRERGLFPARACHFPLLTLAVAWAGPALAVGPVAGGDGPPEDEERNGMSATETTRHLGCAETAKLLRAALKAEFPGVKFSVRSHTYSGGASIDVYWTDGPALARVEAITRLYCGASFDGMIDLKSYHSSLLAGPDGEVEHVHFGADFIFAHREHSEALLARVAGQAAPLGGGGRCGICSQSESFIIHIGDRWASGCTPEHAARLAAQHVAA